MTKININDPTAWQALDWSETVGPKIKSDADVNRARGAWLKRGDPEFSATMQSVAEQRNQDLNYRTKQKQGCQQRDNSYQAEANARPETKTKISKSLAGRKKTAEHEAKVAASNRAKPTDPNWKAALMAGLAKRDRPFHAGPYGVFPSLTAAARHVMEQGLLTNAVKKFEKWKKTDPSNYYFIER
jgi:Zn-finger nucleic acid-binding protein